MDQGGGITCGAIDGQLNVIMRMILISTSRTFATSRTSGASALYTSGAVHTTCKSKINNIKIK